VTVKGDCPHEKDVAKCLAKGEGVSDKGLKSRVLKQGRVLKHHYDPLDIPLHAFFFFLLLITDACRAGLWVTTMENDLLDLLMYQNY